MNNRIENFGFVRVAAAVPLVKVANIEYNLEQIISLLNMAENNSVEVLVFPELCITGYTCGDLFFQQTLLDSAQEALLKILEVSVTKNVVGIIGMPILYDGLLYNTAVVFHKGKICGIVPKVNVHNIKDANEQRWFAMGNSIVENTQINICNQEVNFSSNLLFRTSSLCFSIEFGSDLYSVISPSSYHVLKGAEVVFNLSAIAETAGFDDLKHRINQQSLRCLSGYICAFAGFGESSTDMVFGGRTLIFENGELLNESSCFAMENKLSYTEIDVEYIRNTRRGNPAFVNSKINFSTEINTSVVCINQNIQKLEIISREFDTHPFVPTNKLELKEKCRKAFVIQVQGLVTRLNHTCINKAVIGISGGLDSTWALLVVIGAFDKLGISRKNIIAITMPGFGTSKRTHSNSENLVCYLGTTFKEISIHDACLQHFKDISHDEACHDITYENVQARERTQILMDVANKENALVIGTGDMSELALGWATYNGDHMSMYGVNAGVTKTLIPCLITWYAENKNVDNKVKEILLDIINTPISPELLPANDNGDIAQITEDLVGPYELHDFFLYHFLKNGSSPKKIQMLTEHAFNGIFEKDVIEKWLKNFYRRFFAQQFKRSCLPDGPKVESFSLSPRSGLVMPSDACNNVWFNFFETKNE